MIVMEILHLKAAQEYGLPLLAAKEAYIQFEK